MKKLAGIIQKIFLLIFLLLTAITCTIILQGRLFEKSMMEFRKQELKTLVSLALNSIKDIRTDYEDGKIEYDEALSIVQKRVSRLAYDEAMGKNYIFMSAYDGTMLVQPFQPELIGTNQLDLMDPDDVFIIRELIETARSGSGYFGYKYYSPEGGVMQDKLSYVYGLQDFNCYIGTGMYLNDIKSIVSRFTSLSAVILISLIFAVSLTGGFLLFPILEAVRYITAKYQYMSLNPANEDFFIDTSGYRENSDAGKLVYHFAEMTDALSASNRELKKTIEERNYLIKEIHHRVKNNLQTIISLLSLQINKTTDESVKKIILDSVNRIESMNLIHKKLYLNDRLSAVNLQTYIHELAVQIIKSFDETVHVKLIDDIENIELDIDYTVHLGMIITEIVTNSIKYASSQDNPEIKIGVQKSETGLTMMICDNGPGIPEKYHNGKESSLGIVLIRNLTRQLDGDIKITNSDGTCIEIKIPLKY